MRQISPKDADKCASDLSPRTIPLPENQKFHRLWMQTKTAFSRLCVLLFLFASIAYGISGSLVTVLFWGLSQMHIYLHPWVIFGASFILAGFLYLVLSRF